MKKILIGGIVGGILVFLWQFLSWTVLDLHRSSQQYTSKQDSIISYLSTQFSEDGQYAVPTTPEHATKEQWEAAMKSSEGKPWAIVSYHKAMKVNMGSNMARCLTANIVMIWLLCYILSQLRQPSFGKIFIISLFTGLIVFINAPYTMHIWYETPGIMADLKDAIIGWALVGIWTGRWMSRNTRNIHEPYR